MQRFSPLYPRVFLCYAFVVQILDKKGRAFHKFSLNFLSFFSLPTSCLVKKLLFKRAIKENCAFRLNLSRVFSEKKKKKNIFWEGGEKILHTSWMKERRNGVW